MNRSIVWCCAKDLAHSRPGDIRHLAGALVVTLSLVAAPGLARESERPLWSRAPEKGELMDDQPRVAAPSPLRGDTLIFGWVDDDGFAVLDEIWTWDHGGADPLEGWVGLDVTAQTGTYFRHITSALWTTGTGNTVPAPILAGAGSAWVGAHENQADSLCWDGGLGYGNHWTQRLVSPSLPYTGAGDVDLEFSYFSEAEESFDYTRILLRDDLGDDVPVLDPGFTGDIGLAAGHPASPPTGAFFSTTIPSALLAGHTSFQIVFEFGSDGGWSDEDGHHDTAYGAFGVDNVSLDGAGLPEPVSYTFEASLDGWTPEISPPGESVIGVNHISEYVIEDPCQCELSGNILELHDENQEHPYGQHVSAQSNPVDVLNDVEPVLGGGGGQIAIHAEWDQYSVMPRANGVFYRPGWDYYPYQCPVTGSVQWSGRAGQDNFFYVGNDPLCVGFENSATSNGIPGSGVEQIRFLYEVYSSCDAFGIPPTICTGETNATPIIDNVAIGFTNTPIAPPISFAPGTRYRDGFAQTEFLDPDGVGRADVVCNVNFGNSPPFVQGDSLYVSGPTATSSTRWEARLWFRISREGPGTKPLAYNSWKAAIGDGRNITGGEFTFAWMDSFQAGTQVSRNKFVSYLRENDDDYNSGAGEQSDPNEIIRDDVLVAGSRIEYFVSSNYTATPDENFTLPDTSGQFFSEFAILPSWELVDDTFRFPCLLYIDAVNVGVEAFVEGAFAELGLPHDRFDYLDPSSGWTAPMARGPAPSNAGVTLGQLLGYRALLVSTGRLSASLWPEDWMLFSDWLTAFHCDGSVQRQGLIVNGNSPSSILADREPAILQMLGAVHIAEAYNAYAGDENACVRLEAPVGAAYGTSNSSGDYDYDAYGNWCPLHLDFDVMAPAGSGVGNRSYVNVSTLEETEYAQIVNEDSGTGNFRTVLDGVSYDRIVLRGVEECTSSFENVTGAVKHELAAALEWIFDGAVPSLCEDLCEPTATPDDVRIGAPATTRLYASAPNPFHPRTALRFSLARAGRAELAIFDAAGRKVRTLASGEQSAGLHEVVWDGTDQHGHVLPAGVYWYQLGADGYTSSKKLVLLK